MAWAACAPDPPELAGRRLRLGGTSCRQRRFLDSALESGLLHLLLFRDQRRHDAAPPLIVEIDGVLLVDQLLLFRCRIWPGDVEIPVLHEIEISVASAGLAPSGEFRVALRERRGLGFLGC